MIPKTTFGTKETKINCIKSKINPNIVIIDWINNASTLGYR